MPQAGYGAVSHDPEWPCIQRKVPELSIGQVWTGPEIVEPAGGWPRDAQISDLTTLLVQRRNPMEEAKRQVSDYVASLPRDQVNAKLAQLFMDVFNKLNAEREHVISGISRYAQKQRDLASDLRAKAAGLDKMRAAPDSNPAEIDKGTQQLSWETRIFEERVQSLTYVCEVPTIIEQRLYGLSKIIGDLMVKE
ncbi:hypothetical protein F3Y30_24180 (plasmid) [Sinorhizobium sp. BG8]|nr:hypothetical protein F3Y30_24180 [Sinorhizobium sp. BG8]